MYHGCSKLSLVSHSVSDNTVSWKVLKTSSFKGELQLNVLRIETIEESDASRKVIKALRNTFASTPEENVNSIVLRLTLCEFLEKTTKSCGWVEA